MDKLKKPLVLIDGDIIAYRAAAATDGRQYIVEWTTDKGTKMFQSHKYKKDADISVEELKMIGVSDASVTLSFSPEPEANALKIVKDSLVSLETALSVHTDGLGERKIFVTRGGSFREQEVPSYKQLREGARRPKNLEACKDYLMKHHGAVCAPGEYEADDLLAMSASEGKNCVICSVDKDLLQVPGHHFNWVKGEYKVISPTEGWRNLFSQLLTGDDTDGIPGIRGIGPKKAEKILKGIDDPFMMYVEVLKAYVRDTGILEGESQEDYHMRVIGLIREHMTLLYLIRKPGERFKVPEKRRIPEYNPKYGPEDGYRDYLKLIERVRCISPEAAGYLENPDELPNSFRYSGYLKGIFYWGTHEKCSGYWSDIDKKLEEEDGSRTLERT